MKTSIEELAVFGGRPQFAAPLHVGLPEIPDRARLLERIGGILDRRVYTNAGPLVSELEARAAERLGTRHALAACNATIALQLVAHALGLRGEVVMPAFTFVATAHALRWIGLRPVFCDVDPATHLIDPAAAERHLSDRTAAIVGVHVWGNPCDTDRLDAVARARGVPVFYDAAHAFACARAGTMVGNFGAAEVFSLHATKCLSAFEGAFVTTNDDALAEAVRRLRNFGFTGYDRVESLGINAKMSEASAAMALTLLERLDETIARNRDVRSRLCAELAGLPGLVVHEPAAASAHNAHYFVVEVDEVRAGLSRDQLVRLLHAENVLARRYFYPGVHRMEPYRTEQPEAGHALPATEALCNRVLVLPAAAAVTPEDVGAVGGLLRFALEHASAIRSRLG